jgi:hypothetical protein
LAMMELLGGGGDLHDFLAVEHHFVFGGFNNFDVDGTIGGGFLGAEAAMIHGATFGLYEKKLIALETGHLGPIDGEGLDGVRKADIEGAAVEGLDLACEVVSIFHDDDVGVVSGE